VRTRTLILLAMVCALAILVAGVIQLVRISNASDDTVTVAPVGQSQRVGDLTVTVTGSAPGGTSVVVRARLDATAATTGVPDAGAGWTLLVGGHLEAPTAVPGGAGDACAGRAVAVGEAVDCSVAFPARAGTRTVAYAHGGVQREWRL
jgi:hypothetical protein